MHPCITLRTFRTKTTCTRDKNSIYKEGGSEPPLSVSSCMSALPPACRRQYRSPPSASKAHDFPHARSGVPYVATNCRSGRHGNRRRELSAAATSGSQMQGQIDSVAAPMMGRCGLAQPCSAPNPIRAASFKREYFLNDVRSQRFLCNSEHAI
jgi:hypothetical protein